MSRTGGSRRPSAAPSQTPLACPNMQLVSRGREAISPTPPSNSPSPPAFSCTSVTRQRRFRGRMKRSRWPGSTALGFHDVLDGVWATAIAFLVGDWTATLQLGRDAIHVLGWSGERLRIGMILHL